MTAIEIINKRKELWDSKRDIEIDKNYRDAVANEIIKDEALRREIKEYPELLIEMVFVIVDKDKKTTPFFLNSVQRMFIDRLNNAIKDYNDGLRLSLQFLVLKGRQQGFTSFITAYQLACTISRKNFEGFTVADEDGNASTIFQNKAKYTYGLLPQQLKPTEKFNNRKQLLFDKINSTWEVRTVSANMGRSRTLNFFHGSEAAFWKVLISDVQAGIGEALTKNSIQILESTANGYNEYKELWDSGKWECCFYEWWHTEEYSTELRDNRESFIADIMSKKDWIHERCRWLKDEIKLEWEQIYWYFNKWKSYIKGELIRQEYPCTPEEAFLLSGSCVYDSEKIVNRIEYLRRNNHLIKEGYFYFEWNNPEWQDYIKLDSVKFIESKQKPLIRIYEEPQKDYPYTVGGDTKGEGKDSYAGTVKNNNTQKRCATVEMQINNSKPFAWQLFCLGHYYNKALIGIEMNFNTGPLEELERLKYANQYIREVQDSYTGQLQKKFGWRTDGITRPLMIDNSIALTESHLELYFDIPTLKQMLTFVLDANNRPDALSGCHDDLLISDMICDEISSQQTTRIAKQERFDLSKLPRDLQEDYTGANKEGKAYLKSKWIKMGLFD